MMIFTAINLLLKTRSALIVSLRDTSATQGHKICQEDGVRWAGRIDVYGSIRNVEAPPVAREER